MQRIEKCDRCKRDFYRKFVNAKRNWSQMNEVSFWTEEKSWNDYKILCRACLLDWKMNHNNEFIKLVSEKKKERFSIYQSNGIFNQKDLV